jgi:Protein of unknown function (DUF1553)/Protein of unknown function (DUF1549)
MSYHRLLAVSLGVLTLALTPALRGVDGSVQSAIRNPQTAIEAAARIDQRIAAAWDKDVKPAPLADDAEFFRRVHLDLAGRIPSITEVRDFLEDDRPDKRRLWVDRILEADPDDSSYRDAYVSHFANVWRAWLLAQTNQQAQIQQPALELWLRQVLKANVGYDRLVSDLLTQQPGPGIAIGGGEPSTGAFYAANEFRPENLAGTTARLFLGVKLECAQCHDHPFAQWTRTQFWEYAAFFTDLPQQGRPNQPPARGPRGEIKIMGTDKVVKARFLDGKEPDWKDNRTRPTLVEWMTAADNPFFARAAVNRVWAHFFGVGLVDQPAGAGDETPANYPELLDELAGAFVAHNYDVKFLIRAITASQAYQRASAVSHPSQRNLRLFARMPLRGLSPEQLFDSLAVATEYQDTTPADPLAALRGGPQSPRNQFLGKFPAQDQKTDYQTSILQALYLMNNDFIADRTSLQKNRTLATLADQRTSTARKVESLYLVVLSRPPRADESDRLVKYVDAGGAAGDPKKALADVFWVLLNSPEFLLNH